METIKYIIAEKGEECRVDIDVMHESLLKLPAEMYLSLYQKMHMRIYGDLPTVNYGGCCVSATDDDNANYYGEQEKVTKSYGVGESR